jgi:hypothetical protein
VRLYIAGPMTGIPQFNFPAFQEAAFELRYAGYEVVSPHEEDDPEVQTAARTSLTGSMSDLPPGKAGSDPVLTIVKNVEDIGRCDGIALLDGWEKSSGAAHEIATATRLKMPVAPLALWLSRSDIDPTAEVVNEAAPVTAETPAKSPRRVLLEGAIAAVDGDRNVHYGDPSADFLRTAAMWNAYLDGKDHIDAQDVAAMMALLKLSRIRWSPQKEDSWMDLAGYAACGWHVMHDRGAA